MRAIDALRQRINTNGVLTKEERAFWAVILDGLAKVWDV
jgi:hypothetical protein